MKKVVMSCAAHAAALLLAWPAAAMDLLKAYDLALQGDPRLAQADAQRRSVEENKPQAVARLLPTIGFNAGADDVNSNNKVGFAVYGGKRSDSYWNLSLTVKMSQPIYHHDYWVQLGQADYAVAQAEADYQAAFQDMVLRTVSAYFEVLAQTDALAFAVAEKEAIARQLDQARQRFDVGLVAITDVHEAQAAYDSSLAGEIAAQTALDNAKDSLHEILGEPVDTLSRLAENVPLENPEPAEMTRWAEHALAGNFAVVAARNGVERARKEVDVQQSGHYPTLDLVASHAVQDSSRDRQLTDLGGNLINGWQKMGPRAETDSVGLQLNVPFFQGGAVVSRTRQAAADLEKAQRKLDEQLRAAERSAKNAYRGVVSNISRVQALKSAVRSAQSALEAAEAGLDVGTRTMVDVLQEQRNLYKAKSDYARARYDYVVQGFALKQSAGVLGRDDVDQTNRWLR